MVIGSPEWFFNKANTREKEELRICVETTRKNFIEEFSPSKLEKMGGEELLDKVFGSGRSMLNLLMFDADYLKFGSLGNRKYLWYVYEIDGEWKYNEKNNAEVISFYDAKKYAEEIRDLLVQCIYCIEEHLPLNSVSDYEVLETNLSKYHIYQRCWVLKYYQMIYPQFFSQMYEDNTIDRAIQILGLPNHKKRLVNDGQIALFTRACDVNNVVFGSIYGDTWGWESKQPVCGAAANNYVLSQKPLTEVKSYYYSLEYNSVLNDDFIDLIENNLDENGIEGEEREVITKARVNQSVFRNRLIEKYHKCAFCPIDVPSVLIASHIKPWAMSNRKEKLDVNNGFLLCPNHDKLFDQGFISFDDDGKIMVSQEINAKNQLCMNIEDKLSINLTEENKKYLAYHRQFIFKD